MKKIRLSKRTKAIIKATAFVATGTVISTLRDELDSKNVTISNLSDQVENLKDLVATEFNQICNLKENLSDVELLSESICW